MNVLLTCAGRRNYLVQFFKNALAADGEVFACDASASAPAFMEADRSFIVPSMDDPDYFEALATICRENDVGLIISVNDLELGGLAQHAPRFRAEGTIAVVSSPQVIATCQDKWATFHFLKSCAIPTPETYLSIVDARTALALGKLRFPLLIKPRWGTSSIGVERVDNDRELTLAHEWGQIQVRRTILARLSQANPERCLIVQQWHEGQEYGMDVVNDLAGRHVATLARRKLVMRSGNTDRAITVNEPRLERIGTIIGEQLGHVGSLDCDLLDTPAGCLVLDLNPRFGGGYPFSQLAGANLPAALTAWADRKKVDPRWLTCRSGVLSAKYDGVAVIEPRAKQMEPSSTLAFAT